MPYPHLLSCLHFQFSHPLSWHWKTGDLTNTNLALKVHHSVSAHHYFCLFLGRATILSAHLAGNQHLILQYNLAPVLQIIAAGEMAPAWQKTQSCNKEFTTHNTDAIEALGQTGHHIHWPPYAQCSCPEGKFLIKSYSSWGSGRSIFPHWFRGHAAALTHQSLSRCHSIPHKSLLTLVSSKKQFFRNWWNLKQKTQQLQPKMQTVTSTISENRTVKSHHPATHKKWPLALKILLPWGELSIK